MSNVSLGLGTKLAVWLTIWGVGVIPTNLNLDFSSAISCTLPDKALRNTGYTEAHGINSNTITPQLLTQQFKPSNTPLFTNKASARAGSQVLTLEPPHIKAAFKNFSIKLAASLNPSTIINWSTVAPSSIRRSEAPGVVAEGKLYVFGGYIDTTYTPTSRADVYDPVNDTWTQIIDLPKGLTHSGTAVDEKDIYIAGGYPAKPTGGQRFATRDVWKYNVDTNTWTAMPALPEARGSGALELLGRELHFFGGSDIYRVDKGDHWVLSLDSGTGWTSAAPLPNPRNHLADAVLDGKLYAIGGQRGQKHAGVQNSVHMWNPATNTWIPVASLPRGRSHIGSATFVMDDQIVVAGGISVEGRHVSDLTAYDPLSNSWTALTPMPAARSSGVAGSIGNEIFYTTGAPNFSSITHKGATLGYQTRLYLPTVVRSL